MHNSYFTSSIVGAATLTPRQRLRMAGMTLLVELQQRIIRHVAMYFSMVLLRACWASLVSRSTSVSTTTAEKRGYIVYPPLAVVVLTSCVSFSLSDNDGVCLISMQSALQCSVNWLHIRTKKIWDFKCVPLTQVCVLACVPTYLWTLSESYPEKEFDFEPHPSTVLVSLLCHGYQHHCKQRELDIVTYQSINSVKHSHWYKSA